MSNTFKPGDRIVYVGKYPSYHDAGAVGRHGTVQEQKHFVGTDMVEILLDGDTHNKNVFRENIELDTTAVKVSVPPQYASAQTLVERIVKAELVLQERAFDYELLKGKLLQREAQVLSMQAERNEYAAGYATQREKVEELETHVASLQRLAEMLRTVSLNRYKKIADLEERIGVDQKFIELQAQRLRAARERIEQIRLACITNDGGQALDP